MQRNTLATARVSALIVALLLSGCSSKSNQVNTRLSNEMPQKMLWAWERPEDLRFIDTKQYGVAFLAQTITLTNDSVLPKPRRQPLETAPGSYIIAVTRIETKKGTAERPTLSVEMVAKVVTMIKATLELPDVKGVQIDFDAVVSERNFYRSMMNELAKEIGTRDKGQGMRNSEPSSRVPRPSLTMTSLASWCTGDAWFNDFPVDEAVPMVFQMGADDEKIKNYLRGRNDWNEPLCRGSYGISLDEKEFDGMKDGRRMYYFKNSSWKISDLDQLK